MQEDVMLQNGRATRWVVGALALALTAVGGYILLGERLVGEMHNWRSYFPEIMMNVAKAQLKIEAELASGSGVSSAPLKIQSPYVSHSYVLKNGGIVVSGTEDRFFLLFEPTLVNGAIEWHCVGSPDALFKSDRPGSIADCGKKYRELVGPSK